MSKAKEGVTAYILIGAIALFGSLAGGALICLGAIGAGLVWVKYELPKKFRLKAAS